MDIKKLLTRTVFGLIYCLVIVGALLWDFTGAVILACVLATLGCIEFAKISHDLDRNTIPAVILDVLGCIALCFSCLGWGIFLWIAIIIVRMVVQLYIKSPNPFRELAHSFMSQIYIGLPLALMTLISAIFNSKLILALFFFLWINDTGAFLFGSAFGRHRLFERISPKKSWEGFWGGLLCCIIAAALFGLYCNYFFGMNEVLSIAGIASTRVSVLWTWMGFGIVVSVFGTWGDLVESMIKRTLKIKDSGNLIPGHGGILDRVDSFLLAMPAMAVYIFLLYKNFYI